MIGSANNIFKCTMPNSKIIIFLLNIIFCTSKLGLSNCMLVISHPKYFSNDDKISLTDIMPI